MPTFVLLVVGVLAVWGAARLVREATAEGASAPRITASVALGLVAALVICGQALSGSLGSASTIAHPVAPDVPRTDGLDVQGGVSGSIDEGAMASVDAAVPKDARIMVMCQPGCTEIVPAWILTRLEPRSPVRDPLRADWLVFSGIAPTDPSFAALRLDQVQSFAGNISIAHVAGAAG